MKVKDPMTEDNDQNRSLITFPFEAFGQQAVSVGVRTSRLEMTGSESFVPIRPDIRPPVSDGYVARMAIPGNPKPLRLPIAVDLKYAATDDAKKTTALDCNGYEGRSTEPATFATQIGRILQNNVGGSE